MGSLSTLNHCRTVSSRPKGMVSRESYVCRVIITSIVYIMYYCIADNTIPNNRFPVHMVQSVVLCGITAGSDMIT